MRSRRLIPVLLLLLYPRPAAAEWQVKPFFGITFAGRTTFVDIEKAAGRQNAVIGASGVLIGEVFGLEGDLGLAPGFFEAGGQKLLLNSRVTTLTGNAVVAVPRSIARYTLRPYLVAGAGMMRVSIEGRLGALHVSRTLPAMDVGGGVTGFFNDHVGLNWEVRHFRSLGGDGQTTGVTFVGTEKLSFWRATMAVAFKY